MRAMWSGLVVTAIMTVWLAVCGGSSALAQATEQFQQQQRETLRGLVGVRVLIEDLSPDIERDGLRQDQVRTDVELRLRQAGIRVLTREERGRTPGAPYLYIAVTSVKSVDTTYAFSLQVELIQDVQLSRDPMIKLDAATWSATFVGRVGAGKVREIRSQIADFVDRFINAYLAVNPK